MKKCPAIIIKISMKNKYNVRERCKYVKMIWVVYIVNGQYNPFFRHVLNYVDYQLMYIFKNKF